MKTRFLFGALLALSLVLAACTPAATPTAAPTAAGEPTAATGGLPDLGGREIRIAVENAYNPFNFIDAATGEAVGYDYDLFNEACERLNCTTTFVETSWDTIVAVMGGEAEADTFDVAADGIIWYVNSGKGRLGRFDPKSGDIKEWPSPSGPASHPYAIAVVDGMVWYNESGKRPDMLVRFDPRTEKFQSWPIPSGSIYAGIVRHMRPTRDGNLLIHQSSTNRIMLVTLPAETQ